MHPEYNSLIQNDVWELVSVPENWKAFGSKWHFANKYDSDGNCTKHKHNIVNIKVLTTMTHAYQLLEWVPYVNLCGILK